MLHRPMKLPLALLCIWSAQGFDFVQFAGNGRESGVLYATGFCIEVIETVCGRSTAGGWFMQQPQISSSRQASEARTPSRRPSASRP